jgi:tetratricopeptide (TPR) repeat protein
VLDSMRARQTAGNKSDQAAVLLVSAELARLRGAKDSARAMIQQAAVLDSSAVALSALAATHADAGDLRGAIEVERRIRNSESNVGWEAQFAWVLARYRMGRLYERLGDNAQARKEYETFLSEWSSADDTLPVIVDTRARLKKLLALSPKRES